MESMGEGGSVTPEQLAVRAGRRGPDAEACFNALVGHYQDRLYSFLLRRCRRADVAEDLTQEAFLRAWERLDTYNPRWRFSTWLFTIASRQAVSHFRKSGREARVQRARLVTADHQERDSERCEAGGRLWALALAHLTADQQDALWLRYAEDMDIEDIARVMGKSGVGVRVCLFRARAALARLMPAGPWERAKSPAPKPRRASRLFLEPAGSGA